MGGEIHLAETVGKGGGRNQYQRHCLARGESGLVDDDEETVNLRTTFRQAQAGFCDGEKSACQYQEKLGGVRNNNTYRVTAVAFGALVRARARVLLKARISHFFSPF